MFFPAADVTTVDSSVVGSVFEVLSHLPLIPAIPFFVRMRVWVAVAIVVGVFVFSDAYHICKADWFCFGMGNTSTIVFDATTNTSIITYPGLVKARPVDHTVATGAWALTILMALWGATGGGTESVLPIILLLFVIVYAVYAWPFEFQSIFIVLVTEVLIIAVYVLYRRRANLPPPTRFSLGWIIAGVLIGTTGLTMYFISVIPYDVSHPLWHLCITAAVVCMVIDTNQTRMQRYHLFSNCGKERTELEEDEDEALI
jgi:hypothetical protein